MKPGQYLIVVGDQNDADYTTRIESITDKELDKIMPVIEAVKNFKSYAGSKYGNNGHRFTHDHNWPKGERSPRTDLGEKYPHQIYSHIEQRVVQYFNENYVPYGEHGIHSIESIDLIEVKEGKKLL